MVRLLGLGKDFSAAQDGSGRSDTAGTPQPDKACQEQRRLAPYDPDLFQAQGAGAEQEVAGSRSKTARELLADYGASLAAVVGCIFVSLPMRAYFDPANLVMVYLLGTIYIAITRGLGPAFLSTVLGVLAFDLIFVPPLFIFSVSDTQYLFTVATMFVVAAIVGRLTERIRHQVREVHAKEARTRVMLSITRELAGARGIERLLHTMTGQISRLYGFLSVAYLGESSGLALSPDAPETVRPARHAEEAVHWVLANGQPAGMGTQVHPDCEALYLPMSGVEGTLAVLAVWPQPLGSSFTLEQVHLLESLARQVGLMLDLERLEGERLRHQLEAQSERLKTSLLSSVTHDIQTPLAAIMGSAESLLLHGGDMGPEERASLALNMRDEAARLSRLVANLLRMTKLESGAVKPDLQLQPIDDPLGAALVLLDEQLAGRELVLDIPQDLPLLALDAVLMEQYFHNILENAVKYTPPGAPLEIAARQDGDVVRVEVSDNGPGLDPGELEKVFGLFYQGSGKQGRTDARSGYGVGLAVCRAIAQVHGGELVAENRPGGGAVFRLTLPVPEEQQEHGLMMEEQ